MIRLRTLAAVVFALLLAFSSGAMAVARGQSTSAGTLVLCTGKGLVVLTVDAQGRPTGPAHICPDCALSFFAADAPPPAAVERPVTAVVPLDIRPADSPRPEGRPVAGYSARAPPFPS